METNAEKNIKKLSEGELIDLNGFVMENPKVVNSLVKILNNIEQTKGLTRVEMGEIIDYLFDEHISKEKIQKKEHRELEILVKNMDKNLN